MEKEDDRCKNSQHNDGDFKGHIERLDHQMLQLKEELHDMKSLIDRRLTDLFNLLSSSPPTSSLSLSSASIDVSPGRPLTEAAEAMGSSRWGLRRSYKRDRDHGSEGQLPQLEVNESAGLVEMEEEEEEEEEEFIRHSRKRRRVELEDGTTVKEDLFEFEMNCLLLPRLPVEVWTHVLSFVLAKKFPFASLNSTLLTCKLWRKIGLSLITSYTMPATKPKKLARKSLAFLFTNCPNLRSLRVRNCPIVNSMLYHLPERITLLDCGFTQITEEALEYLPLSLKALSIDNMVITDNGFNDLPSRLDTLSLRQVILSPNCARKMAQRFTRLRKLTLSAQVTNVTAFLPPSIECLRLHVGSIGEKNYLWNDNVIATIVPLSHLQILEISRCNITNAGKQTLAETHIRHLVIRQAKLTDTGMCYLPRTLVSLVLESIPTITDNGLRGLPLTLQSLALVKMEKLTGHGLLSFLEVASNLRYLVLDEELGAALRLADAERKLADRSLTITVKKENEPCPKLHQLPVHSPAGTSSSPSSSS